jgi:hypothetical protein
MKKHKPRILYVTPVWPGRTATGVHGRALNVLRALQQIGTVEAVLLGDEGASDADLSEPEREIKLAHTIQVTPQGNSGFIEKLRWTLAPAHVAKVFRASLWERPMRWSCFRSIFLRVLLSTTYGFRGQNAVLWHVDLWHLDCSF